MTCREAKTALLHAEELEEGDTGVGLVRHLESCDQCRADLWVAVVQDVVRLFRSVDGSSAQSVRPLSPAEKERMFSRLKAAIEDTDPKKRPD